MICFISCWLQEHFKISLILIMILLSFPTFLLRAAVGCLLPMHDANVCNKYVSTQFTQRLDINNNSREQKKRSPQARCRSGKRSRISGIVI